LEECYINNDYDVNGNGNFGILDITYLISYLYFDGSDLVCPE